MTNNTSSGGRHISSLAVGLASFVAGMATTLLAVKIMERKHDRSNGTQCCCYGAVVVSALYCDEHPICSS